jgi:hypothetical protein
MLLAAPGCSWPILAAAGCSWLLLAAPGRSWLLLTLEVDMGTLASCQYASALPVRTTGKRVSLGFVLSSTGKDLTYLPGNEAYPGNVATLVRHSMLIGSFAEVFTGLDP